MGTQDCTRDTCNRTTGDTTYICPECGHNLTHLLSNVADTTAPPRTPGGAPRTIPGLATDLDVAITKQTRFTQVRGRRPATPETDDPHTVLSVQPLAYGYAASEARYNLVTTLAVWAALVAEQRGLALPERDLEPLAAFVVAQVPWLRQQPAGADAFDELTAALDNATHTIDRPADAAFAGPCGAALPGQDLYDPHKARCPGFLYAREGSRVAVCDECGRDDDLDEARAPLLETIDALILTGPQIVLALGGLGSPVKPDTIRKWASRGHLTNRAPAGAQPRYRVGDVRQLATPELRATLRTAPTREAIPA